MNRKAETIFLSALYLFFGTAVFHAVPRFALVFADLYGGSAAGLPVLTRMLFAPPPILWLAAGVAAPGFILFLNQKYNTFWINLGFLLGLALTGFAVVAALFLPLIVTIRAM